MNTKKFGLVGIASNVQFGKGGPRIKNNAGVLQAKNAADNALVNFQALAPVNDNDVVTKRYLETQANVIINGQIDGGTPPSPVDGLIYIVTTAGGAFALNEIYRREAGVFVLLPLVDGFVISVADPLIGGVDEYAMGRYMYDLDTTSWIYIGPAAAVSKIDSNEIVTLAFGSAATLNIGAALPLGAIAKKVYVNVTQAFDGIDPILDIGDAGDANRLMDNAEIDLKTVGLYVSDVYNLYGASTQLEAAYVADSSTVGQANILVEYRLP